MRTPCPKCQASRGLAEYHNGTWCFACNYFSPSKSLVKHFKPVIVDNLDGIKTLDYIYHFKQFKWLQQYYITKKLCNKHDIKFDLRSQRIIFPYDDIYGKIVFCWCRSTDKEGLKWLFKGHKDIALYYLKHKDFTLSNKLIITEDVISSIRTSEYYDSVALGGTNANSPLFTPLILQYQEILIWLDGDQAGRDAAKTLRSKLKLLRPVRIIRTLKDPKSHTPSEMSEVLQCNLTLKKSI